MNQMTEGELYRLILKWKETHNISTEALRELDEILDKLKGEDDESRN